MRVKILIYEDNQSLSQSLTQLLKDEGSFELAGVFSHCDNIVKELASSKAELVIMDIDMPGMGGIKGVRAAKNVNPDIKIIMHTVFDDDERIFDSICAGADGYLLKNAGPAKFVEALQNVMNGDVAMSPFVAQRVFRHFRNKHSPARENYNLTERETEILQMLVKGNTYRMIAEKGYISVNTVKRHLQNIYSKLHVSCGTEAVAKAIRQRITDL